VEYEYFCAMHPQVVSDEPGKCPICGMPLSKRPKVGAMAGEEGLPEVPMVQLSPRQIRLAGVKVEPVTYRHLVKTIYTVGNMTYDERLLAYVTAWVAGRVDKLFVDFTGVEVKKDEPLLWLYSPELVSAQREYLLALETQEKMRNSSLDEIVKSADYMLDATRDRLLLWGITEGQIEELTETGEVQEHMTIYAPIAGTVIKKDVLEGQYVEEGTRMYTIADLTKLWMMADVYEYEMSLIKLGQKVDITTAAFPGRTFIGTVAFIEPFLNEITRSLKVRVDVPNPKLKLKPAMFVNVTIKIPLGDSDEELIKKPTGVLAIPRSAVLDTGRRKLIYVEIEEGLFEAREIETGFTAEGYVEVLEGLKEGEMVVAAGSFLLDAESQLGPGVGAQYFGATGGPEGEEETHVKEKAPSKTHRH
ncbi:MAG: efflux RND transporter periplasmic adaptor subunit, partial [Candidatus Brocadiales bacterium]